jgi:hypothetical protein
MLGMGIKLTADASGAQRAVAAFSKNAEKQVAGIGKELTGRIAGAFAAGAVVSAVGGFIQSIRGSVDEIKDLSDQLEISTDDVQKLQKAANDVGVKFGVVTTALQKIEAMRAQALTGDKKAIGIFDALGANANDSALSILQRAAEESSKSTEKNAAAFELLGKKAVILKNLVTELRNQGPIKIIDDDQIKQIDQVQGQLEETQRLMKAAGAGPLTTFFRGVTGVLNMFNPDVRKRINEIEAQNLKGEIGIGKAIELEAMALLGMEDQEGKKFDALDLQDALRKRRGVKTVAGSEAAAVATPAQSAITLGASGDALSRIGLFVGGRPEVGALRNIEANTRETAQATRQLLTEMRLTREAMESN